MNLKLNSKFLLLFFSFFVLVVTPLWAAKTEIPPQAREQGIPPALVDVGIEEKLGAELPIHEVELVKEDGSKILLADILKDGKPVVLSLIYFECPSMCSTVLNGLLQSLKKLEWTVGKEFNVLSVSFDPRENNELAAKKKKNYIDFYGRADAELGWFFLTGEEKSIKRLTDSVGFKYRWVEEEEQFAHGAAAFVITPQGKLSRILYGVEYSPKDLKASLFEAASGKIGTVMERLILFCYRYDPLTRKYSIVLSRIVQGMSGLLVLLGGVYLGVFWLRQIRRTKSET